MHVQIEDIDDELKVQFCTRDDADGLYNRTQQESMTEDELEQYEQAIKASE